MIEYTENAASCPHSGNDGNAHFDSETVAAARPQGGMLERGD